MKVTCDISLKPMLTEEEASTYLGISKRSLIDLRNGAKISFRRLRLKGESESRGKIYYERTDLDEWFAKNTSLYKSSTEHFKKTKK